MLLQLRDFIKKNGEVSLQQLAREFKTEADALQPMLDFWVHKGIICQLDMSISCNKGCGSCKPMGNLYYQYAL